MRFLLCVLALAAVALVGAQVVPAPPNPPTHLRYDPFARRAVDPFAVVVAAPARGHICPCHCSVCDGCCQCSYPNECSTLHWIASTDPSDPGYFLCSDKHVYGGLYPSGRYRRYVKGEWGDICDPPRIGGMVCGPTGCRYVSGPGLPTAPWSPAAPVLELPGVGAMGAGGGGCASGSCGSSGRRGGRRR